jgi:hypothetical protein
MRWLTPPPARTAAFSSERQPGVVLRAVHDVHEAAGERGDAGEALQEVEGDALSREDGARGSVEREHDIAVLHVCAVVEMEMAGDARIEAQEHGGGRRDASEDAVRLGDDLGADAQPGGDGPAGGPVAGAAVLFEGQVDEVERGVIDDVRGAGATDVRRGRLLHLPRTSE